MKTLYFITAFFFLLISVKSKAQIATTTEKIDPYTNPVILSHYSVSDLLSLEATDSLKFKTIVYYYTRSFYAESIMCSDCIQTEITSIDISEFEYLRKKNYNYTKDFTKYGFKLTLIASDDLEYKMPIHLPLTTSLDEDDE